MASDPSASYMSSTDDSDSELRDKQVDVPSLLDRLKSPAASELARKRKMKGNPMKKKRCLGAVAAEPLSISPSTRIKEFPNEKLSVVSGKIFCTACCEKSVILQHIKSLKHANGKGCLKKNELRERKISDMLLNSMISSITRLGRHFLMMPEFIYRIKVVSTFLKAGVPLLKADIFHSLLEERGFRLSDSSNLYQLIPFLHEEGKATIKKEINEQCFQSYLMELHM